MKKIFKEAVFLLVGVFVITNAVSFIRSPKLELDTSKYFPKDTQIVYFYTKWCKVCKVEKSAIKEVSKSLKVVKVDADERKYLAEIFKIKGFPTIIYLKNGKVLYIDMGYTSSLMIRVKESLLSVF